MTEEEIKQEEHYKEMANAYIDKGIKSAGGAKLPERLRNDFVCMFVAGCFAATKELRSQIAEKDKQIEELKATYKKQRNKRIDELQKKNHDLEAQIEKMKCCGNCNEKHCSINECHWERKE